MAAPGHRPRRTPIAPAARGHKRGHVVAFFVLVAVVLITCGAAAGPDIGATFWIAPGLLGLTWPLARSAARAEGRAETARFIMLAAGLKVIVGSVLYYATINLLYGSSSDAGEYDSAGRVVAANLRDGNFGGLGSFSGTRAVEILTGGIYTLFGDSLLGGFMLYSWLGFVGLWCFYRAFVIGMPGGDIAKYRGLIFLFPSMWFWSSVTGKEALMLFFLGVATLGMTRVMTGRWLGVLLVVFGLWGVAVVRPHMAVIIVAGFAGVLLVRGRDRVRLSSPLARLLLAVLLVMFMPFLFARLTSFFAVERLDTGSVNAILTEVSADTAIGGSGVRREDEPGGPSATRALLVLVRPLPWEVPNAQGLLAAAETTALLGMGYQARRRRSRLRALVMRYPLAGFSFAALCAFAYAFSAISNLGILARQRSLIFPYVFVLIAGGAPSKRPVDQQMAATSRDLDPVVNGGRVV